MRPLVLLILVVLLPRAVQPAPKPSPKLLAIVVVDQMIPELFERHAREYTAGLKILREKSSFFPHARFFHVPTETGPGHAVIVTGQPPGKTGIVGNDWHDRATGKRVYATDDPKHGTGPYQLTTSTLGDALKKTNPDSKVVSLSYKARSAVLMGGHKADLAVWFSLGSREFVTSSYYGPSPEWLEAFNEKMEQQIPWWPKFALMLRSPRIDDYVLDLAKESIRQYQLGKDDACDLLAISFSATDNIGHRYGTFSPQMHKQLLNLDRVLGELMAAIEEQTGTDYVLVLTSDHGILPLPEGPEGKKMGAKRVSKRRFEKLLESALAHAHPGGPWITEMLIPDVYLNKRLVEEKGINWDQFVANAARQVKTVAGVEAVYVPPDFQKKDDYSSLYERSFFKDRSGDLLIRLKPGLLPTDSRVETSHGTPYDYDSVVPLLFFGKPFVVKSFIEPVAVEDIAPTCAHLLGLNFPPSDRGRVLKEIFQPDR